MRAARALALLCCLLAASATAVRAQEDAPTLTDTLVELADADTVRALFADARTLPATPWRAQPSSRLAPDGCHAMRRAPRAPAAPNSARACVRSCLT
jgi:hypothetical protein